MKYLQLLLIAIVFNVTAPDNFPPKSPKGPNGPAQPI